MYRRDLLKYGFACTISTIGINLQQADKWYVDYKLLSGWANVDIKNICKTEIKKLRTKSTCDGKTIYKYVDFYHHYINFNRGIWIPIISYDNEIYPLNTALKKYIDGIYEYCGMTNEIQSNTNLQIILNKPDFKIGIISHQEASATHNANHILQNV